MTPTGSGSADVSAVDGILVGKSAGPSHPYEIGVVDPDTGVYTVVSSFPAEAQVPRFGPGNRLSPDLLRLAAIGREGSGASRVGWYEEDGDFLPVGPNLTNDAFAPSSEFREAFFNYEGQLVYSLRSQGTDGDEYFVVDSETNDVTQITNGGMYGPKELPDGSFAPDNSCYNAVYSFIRPDRYLLADFDQIHTGLFSDLPRLGSCGPGTNSQALLPEANVTLVTQPVMVRDQSKVAFRYDGGPTVYTVDLNGGEPKLVPGSFADMTLLEWRMP